MLEHARSQPSSSFNERPSLEEVRHNILGFPLACECTGTRSLHTSHAHSYIHLHEKENHSDITLDSRLSNRMSGVKNQSSKVKASGLETWFNGYEQSLVALPKDEGSIPS